MRAAAIILLVFSVCAADLVDVGVISDTEGVAIRGCHPGDEALIEVVPSNPGPHRPGGFFSTTNRLLTLKHPAMTMVPTGTNVLRIQILCAGQTSEVREVRFVLRRPIPAPRVGRGLTADAGPRPPMPQGLVPALPATNHFPSYAEFLKRTTEGRRRGE